MLLTIARSAGAAGGVAGAAAGSYAWNNLTYTRRDAGKVVRAGFTRRQITLSNGTTLVYSEGPAAGHALALIHGLGSAEQSYESI